MSKCKKCGQKIFWIKTDKGNSIPCDPNEVVYWADPKGRDRVVTPNGEVIACRLTGDDQKATGIGYIAHFATCPYADEFRRKKIMWDESEKAKKTPMKRTKPKAFYHLWIREGALRNFLKNADFRKQKEMKDHCVWEMKQIRRVILSRFYIPTLGKAPVRHD